MEILVVDDNELVRKVVCKLLGASGIDVLSAASGQEAIDIYTKEGSHIDCVLLDYSMPDMNGAEVLQKLRRISPAAQVLLCTGDGAGDEHGEFAGLDEKPDAVLPKPFRVGDLLRALEALKT